MSADDNRSLGELREVLEVEALRLAMEREPRTLAADLSAVVERMRSALGADDLQAYRELDDAFHHAIFALCGNVYLEKTFHMLSFRIQALRNHLSRDMKLNDRSFVDHEALGRHVAAGEVDDALALMRSHIRDTVMNYKEQAQATASQTPPRRVLIERMEQFARAALAETGADDETAGSVVKALSHASIHGVDTHGYRLLPHYLEGLQRGRLNPRPDVRLVTEHAGAALLDGGDGHGARATYAAVEHAIRFARASGTGAVAVRSSSHFGAAGAYSIEIARAGLVGFCFCNSDAFVRLHGGAQRFHGTNPISMACPAGEGEDPWLFDMATSAIPFNKVQLSRALGVPLPEDTASNVTGRNVTDPDEAEMLAPLGGEFGYKGAGLAGISEILSSALSGAPLSHELPPMISDDMETPRKLGAFVLAIDPAAFAGAELFMETLRRYRHAIRCSATSPGATVIAAGDREWDEARRRRAAGILLDMTAVEALARFSDRTGVPPLELAD